MLLAAIHLFLFAIVTARANAGVRQHLVTQDAHERGTRQLQAQVDAVLALPGLREGSTPIVMLHEPGSHVHGMFVLFHGFSGNAASSAQQAEILYNSGFNVYAVNLPGFAQTGEYWVGTTLRRSKWYDAARKALLDDERIVKAVRIIKSSEILSTPRLAEEIGFELNPTVAEIHHAQLPPSAA